MRIKNVSGYGDLEVPLLGAVLEAGEVADVTEDQARRLLPQRDNFEPADDEARDLADSLDADRADEVVEQAHEAGMPAGNARRSAWVSWAQSRGDSAADAKTRTQLIEEHGPAVVVDEDAGVSDPGSSSSGDDTNENEGH